MLIVESSSSTTNFKMADWDPKPKAAIPWDFSLDDDNIMLGPSDASPEPAKSDGGPGPDLSNNDPEPGESNEDRKTLPDEIEENRQVLHGEWSSMACRK